MEGESTDGAFVQKYNGGGAARSHSEKNTALVLEVAGSNGNLLAEQGEEATHCLKHLLHPPLIDVQVEGII